MKKALKVKHGGSPFKRSRSPAPGKVPDSEYKPGAVAELNEYDKLYLLLAKENNQGLFNTLCYDLGAAGLSDLYNMDKSVIKSKYGVVMSGKIKTALEHLPKDEKKVDFDNLIKFNSRKHGYKEELQAKGVPLIDRKDLKFKKKITNGPFAGAVCLAQWTKPNSEKVLVCLRYDNNSSQRNRFICEAEVSRLLQHENTLAVHGAVILGDYAESIALVVDYTPFGNIRESVAKQSVHGICSYVRQIAEALAYIESKGFIHTRMSAQFVYLMEPEKVKIGGLWGCVRRSDMAISSAEGRLRVNRSSRAKGLVDKSFSLGDTVTWFGYCMTSCFEYLEYYRSQRWAWLMPLQKQINEDFGVLCPDIYKSLFKRCSAQNPTERPSLTEVLQFVSQKNVPARLQVTEDFVGDSKGSLSCSKADVLTLISKSKDKKGRWFGEKLGGEVGFFDGCYTKEIDTADETFTASAEAAVAHFEPEVAAEERIPELVIPAEILARGAQAELAYWRALRNGKVRVYRGRIMLVGQDRAGKTSLKKSLLGMPFDPKQQSTEGVEIDPSVFEVEVDKVTNWQRVEDKKLTSQFADELARMVVGELKKAPTEPSENKEAEEGKQCLEVEEDADDSNKEKQIEVVQLKPDLLPDVQVTDRLVKQPDPTASDVTKDETSSEAQKVQINIDVASGSVPEDITKLVVQYLQELKLEEAVDSKEAVVSVWDFAGQHLYYASHPVFLSPRAIYVLVYNLSKDLNAKAEPCVRQGVYDIILENTTDETNLENMLSWLVSIHSVAKYEDEDVEKGGEEKLPYMRPPVVIVGTHSDHPHQEPKRAEACIKKSISRKTFEQHVVRPFFVVNNTLSSADPGVQKLRQKINELFQMEPYMGEDVPVRWFSFEKVAKALVEKKTNYLELDQLERIAREVCLIEDETEVASMLNFYHDLGVIIKYGSTVVLQAQWLIDLFKKLITIRPYDEQDPRFSDHWEELEEQGILRPQLVDHVFSGFISKGQSREDILNMMEMYGLIARFGNHSQVQTPSFGRSEMKDAKYFVPAQLRSSPKSLADMEPTEGDPCPLYVHFLDGFLPHGLFPQVVSRFIKWCSQEGCRHEPNLYLNVARFILGRNGVHDLILIRHKRFIKVVIKTVKPAVEEKPAGNSGLAPRQYNPAIEARRFLEATLEELSTETPWLRNIRYELAVLCPSCAGPESQCSKHRKNGCNNDDCLHLLGIRYGEPLICTKTYGDNSRVDSLRVEGWFVETPCEEENIEAEIEVRTEASVVDAPTVAPRPPVFISYQWDIQETVKELKDRLEKAGFQCWMDINQMGGGDALNAEIDAGIRASMVFIACVTEKYCKSENCQRETTLADLLRKPIVPLLLQPMDWPPAGQLAMIMAKLLYVDMTLGQEAIPQEKFDELTKKLEQQMSR